MKKLFAIATAIFGLLVATAASAQDRPTKELRFCSGGKTGMYYQVAGEIGERLAQMGYKVIRVETAGSVANLRAMNGQADKPCDVGVTQNDALRNFIVKNPGARQALHRGPALYEEAVHFMCNKRWADKNGVARVPDILKFADKGTFTIATGSPNSGVNETWLSLIAADNRYGKLQTSTDSGVKAADKVADGNDIQCMIYTAALNTGLMKDINANYGGKIILLGFNDKDLDNAKDANGQSIYRLDVIPSGTYPKLQPSGTLWGTKEVNTAYVGANLIYSTEWELRSGGVEDLIKAKNQAQPTINHMISGNK